MTAKTNHNTKSPRKPLTRHRNNSNGGADTGAKNRPMESSKEESSTFFVSIKNEHKYMTMLIQLLEEQLELLEDKKAADFNLMYDIMHYLDHFPDQFHHPKEDLMLSLVVKRDPSMKKAVRQIEKEHAQLRAQGKKAFNALKSAIGDYSTTKKQKIASLCNDYVASLKTHMHKEEKDILPYAKDLLDINDWQEIATQFAPVKDPLFGPKVQEPYNKLYDQIKDRFDKAAEEVTLVEFIGISAIMESIEPLSNGFEEIGTIIKEKSKEAYKKNVRCYKTLLRAQTRDRSDYIVLPVNCALDTLDCFVEGLAGISSVLRKTKDEV